MAPTRLRTLLRWSHIAIGMLLGIYICSPLHLDPITTLVARLALVPLVGMTGIAMWQKGRLSRLFKKSSRNARLSPARS